MNHAAPARPHRSSSSPWLACALVALLCPAGAATLGCSTTSGAEGGGGEPSAEPSSSSEDGPKAAAHPSDHGAGQGAAHGATSAPPESGESFTGIVRQTMDSGGYTYMHVEVEGAGDLRWAAAEQADVAVGDRVVLRVSMQARDFHSPTLDRTFDALWFVYIEASSKPGQAGPGSAAEVTDTI